MRLVKIAAAGCHFYRLYLAHHNETALAMETLDKAILFKSEKFDFTSDLPEDYNAGNRFYGRDVAEFLCGRLKAREFDADFLDEDWGWLILGRVAPSTSFEIAVYNFNEHGEGGRAGAPEWGLWIHAFQRRRLLGIVPRKLKTGVPPAVEAVVMEAIKEIGASPRAWEDGPAR
jgi:hypothetical protein